MSIGRGDLAELARCLAASGLAVLELDGPGIRMHLRRRPREAAAGVTSAITVTAPGAGHVLYAHPLHEAPLAPPGSLVRAGQVLALLRIGVLLRPVLAPTDGVAGAALAENGTLVGYGDGLLTLHPSPLEAG